MADENFRTNAQAEADHRHSPTSLSGQGGPEGDSSPGQDETRTPAPRPRQLWLLGAVAAVAAVAGIVAWSMSPAGGGAGGEMGFTIIDEPQQVLDYVRQQNLPPATAQKLEEKAKARELIVWRVTQFPGFYQQQGQVYTIENGIDRHDFTIKSEGQSFGVFAERTTPAFNFTADSDPTSARMAGTWTTRAGHTDYDMHAGQTIVVPVR